MNTKIFKMAVLTMLVVSVFAGNVWAKKAANERMIQGTVHVMKDKEGKITSVKLMVNDKISYSVTLNEKGKELGQKMEGKKVDVTGIVEMKAKFEWLTVKSYSEVMAKPAK